MEIFEKGLILKDSIENYKRYGKSVGFVPTMGSLHEGHLELIKRAREENDIVVASIFVNPTQFNDKNDYLKYPRDVQRDIELLKEEKCDIVFIPEEREMYPEMDNRDFELGGLDKVMEGKYRPGHFRGVVQIVSKLFDVVVPDRAYFGEKDFQQLTIIRYYIKENNYPVEIIGCPIVREESGLAMSSRNRRLTEKQREEASLIYKTLEESLKCIKSKKIDEIKEWVMNTINKNNMLEVEYFEIVNDKTLKWVEEIKQNTGVVGCIAVYCGDVRLIDNIRYN